MKDRIYQLMQHTGLKQAEFAERLGMSAGSVSNIFTGRTNPTNNHVQAIHRAFPQVNINWLLFGEGDMMDHAEGDADAPSPDAAPAAEGAPAATLPTASTGKNGAAAAAAGPRPTPSSPAAPIPVAAAEMPAVAPVVLRRQVKEIRVFYDDGTYEAFSPLKV